MGTWAVSTTLPLALLTHPGASTSCFAVELVGWVAVVKGITHCCPFLSAAGPTDAIAASNAIAT